MYGERKREREVREGPDADEEQGAPPFLQRVGGATESAHILANLVPEPPNWYKSFDELVTPIC